MIFRWKFFITYRKTSTAKTFAGDRESCRGKVNDTNTLTWERCIHKKGGRTTTKPAKSLIQYATHCQQQVRQGKAIILPLIIQRQVQMSVLEGVRTAIKNCLEGCQSVYYDIQQDGLVATLADKHSHPAHSLSDGQLSRRKFWRWVCQNFHLRIKEVWAVGNAKTFAGDRETILAMSADIAYRAAVLNPHLGEKARLETPGIVLIDEIDLHLHPNWQRQIIKSLRTTFPLIQFIATTHSPSIVQSLQPGELINLNDYDIGEYYDKSIEDILELVMGVDNPQRSQRYKAMVKAAKEYYQVLENAKSAQPEQIAALEKRLDELVAPFSDDVAYHTFLEMERTAAGLGSKHETS